MNLDLEIGDDEVVSEVDVVEDNIGATLSERASPDGRDGSRRGARAGGAGLDPASRAALGPASRALKS
jgi:hypothetical protein